MTAVRRPLVDKIVRIALGIALFSGIPAWSDPCGPGFDAIVFFDNFAERMPEKLAELPELKDLVLAVAKDERVRLSTRLRIAKALDDPDLTVVRLTQALADKTDSKTDEGWLQGSDDKVGFRVVQDVKLTASVNGSNVPDIAVPRKSLLAVGAGSDQKPVTSTVQFRILIHELAHYRMQQFLEKNGERLAKAFSKPEAIAAVESVGRASMKFPDPRLKVVAERIPDADWKRPLVYLDEKGKPVFSAQFYDLLQERYALEVEAELREIPAFRERFPKLFPVRRTRIGVDVVNHYEIVDPRVQGLASLPLYDLLRGKIPEMKENAGEPMFEWPLPTTSLSPDETRLLQFPPAIARALGKKPK